MKWFIVICSCTLLGVQSMGLNAYFMVRKILLFEQMHARELKFSPAVECFEFSMKKFADIPDEVEIDGKMYDVVDAAQNEGRIILYAIHDTAEDELLAFVKSFSDDEADSKQIPAAIMSVITLLYLPAVFSFLIFRRWTVWFCDYIFFHFPSQIVMRFTPPPELPASLASMHC